ncbi:longitudinals lacking protein, isoforms F/I/K/T-like [Schistocerca piceifrons]|uniref:longitudinals lacking protein, isoforms F/I/K/T-like n=1 Tax=Schistocerca piceifrons TaxID=274613 RepID=UPI001F5EF59C|nr:longitudinals lacking protein, isoforms F/I/K/T-like [Schistocerca piceifrons]
MIREFGIKSKLSNLICETLSDTKSKVEFQGGISKAFNIKTGVSQGAGLSPLFFNCVLEKIVREWKQKLKEEKLSPIRLGTKNKGKSEVTSVFHPYNAMGVTTSNYLLGTDDSINTYQTTEIYKCLCGKEYQRKASLKRHVTFECGKERRFQCPFCPNRSIHKCHLLKHIQCKHKDKLLYSSPYIGNL